MIFSCIELLATKNHSLCIEDLQPDKGHFSRQHILKLSNLWDWIRVQCKGDVFDGGFKIGTNITQDDLVAISFWTMITKAVDFGYPGIFIGKDVVAANDQITPIWSRSKIFWSYVQVIHRK